MRASSKCCSLIPVKIKELDSFNRQAAGSRADDTMRLCQVQEFLCICSSTNNNRIIDTSIISSNIFMNFFHLYACKKVISCLEPNEMNISYCATNCSVSVILPTSKIVEISSDWWIRMIRMSCIVKVANNRPTWELSRNHIMENSESISSIRMR